jgi:hypothetical protein
MIACAKRCVLSYTSYELSDRLSKAIDRIKEDVNDELC